LEQKENVVLIGKKPVMNYVIACLTFFNSGAKQVSIKARGKAICCAIDTVELLKRSFIKNLKIQEITIGTEEMVRDKGEKTNVSTIHIEILR